MIKKTDFYEEYRVSDSTPTSINLSTVALSDYSSIMANFLNEHFGGICRVKICNDPPLENNYARLSEDYLAYFFKLMLSFVNGRGIVDVTMRIDYDRYVIDVHCDGHLPFTTNEINELARQAGNAGLDARFTDTDLTLSIIASFKRSYMVYAISRGRIISKINETFYAGFVPGLDG